MLAIHLSSSSLFGMAYVHTPLPLAVQDIDFWTAQRTDEGIKGDPIDPVFSDPQPKNPQGLEFFFQNG